MNNYEEISNAMTALAADDFLYGFKCCAREFGTKFLEDGFARKLPDPEGKTVDVCRYVVAETGQRLPRSMCLYFDAKDFFLGDMFSSIYDVSGEAMVNNLTQKAICSMRRRTRKKEKGWTVAA